MVTVGDEEAEEGLLERLAKGADRGVRVWDEALAGADLLAVARVLAARGRSARRRIWCCAACSPPTRSTAPRGSRSPATSSCRTSRSSSSSTTTPASATATVKRELEGGLVEVLRIANAGAADDPDRNQRAALREAAGDQAGAREAAGGDGARDLGPRSEAIARRRRLAAARARAARPGRRRRDARRLAGRGRDADRRDRQGADGPDERVLVVAETRRGELREVSLELIGAALAVKEPAGGRRRGRGDRPEPRRSAAALAGRGRR